LHIFDRLLNKILQAVGLQAWDALNLFLPSMNPRHEDRPVYAAMLSIHEHRYRDALNVVSDARDKLGPELTALWRESCVEVVDFF
jgi:hypothetical protein